MVLVDEIDKAATRQDYGRLWDSLLGFLEPDNAAAYMDPALQVELNLAAVSYVATANRLEHLAVLLRDRMRSWDSLRRVPTTSTHSSCQ